MVIKKHFFVFLYFFFCNLGSSKYSGNMGVCHPEMLTLTLHADRLHGYGLAVSVGEHSENRSADILITRIVPDSPAYR